MLRKRKLRHKPTSAQTVVPSSWSALSPTAPPRNSFTETDYYRTTKHEIHSPISWAAIGSVTPLNVDGSEVHLTAHVYPVKKIDHEEESPTVAERATGQSLKRVAALWLAVDAFLRKWRRNDQSSPAR